MSTIQYQLTHNEAVGTAFRRRMARPSVWTFLGALVLVALALALMGPPAIDAAPYLVGIAAVFPFAMYFGRTPEYLFLYPGTGPNALTVPMRAFDGPTLEEFVRYLERMGPAA